VQTRNGEKTTKSTGTSEKRVIFRAGGTKGRKETTKKAEARTIPAALGEKGPQGKTAKGGLIIQSGESKYWRTGNFLETF